MGAGEGNFDLSRVAGDVVVVVVEEEGEMESVTNRSEGFGPEGLEFDERYLTCRLADEYVQSPKTPFYSL